MSILRKDIYEMLNEVDMKLETFSYEKLSEIENRRVKSKILKTIKKKPAKWKSTLVAASICLLVGIGGISVATAAGVLPIPENFKTILGLDSNEKVNVANNMGKSLHVADENRGYKIAVEGLVKDDTNIILVYKIEKENGGTLGEKGEICTGVNFDDAESSNVTNGTLGKKIEQKYNSHSILYCTTFSAVENISKNKKLEISLKNMELSFRKKRVEVKGKWNFEIPIDDKESFVDLAHHQMISLGTHRAQIDELKLSPIGYSVKITSKEKLNQFYKIIKMVDGKRKLRLKNGKEIELDGGSSVIANDDGSHTFCIVGSFEKMILLKDMDQVILGEDTFSIKN